MAPTSALVPLRPPCLHPHPFYPLSICSNRPLSNNLRVTLFSRGSQCCTVVESRFLSVLRRTCVVCPCLTATPPFSGPQSSGTFLLYLPARLVPLPFPLVTCPQSHKCPPGGARTKPASGLGKRLSGVGTGWKRFQGRRIACRRGSVPCTPGSSPTALTRIGTGTQQRLESHQRKVLFQAPKPPGLNCEASRFGTLASCVQTAVPEGR